MAEAFILLQKWPYNFENMQIPGHQLTNHLVLLQFFSGKKGEGAALDLWSCLLGDSNPFAAVFSWFHITYGSIT